MDDDFMTVKTLLPTTPLPSNDTRPALTTNRLLIRPLGPSDLDAMHTLRTQPEVMQWTSSGRIDQNIEETRDKLNLFLPPNDTTTVNCAICVKDTGEFIGFGGCHLFPAEHGWPEMGYLLRREFWGRGMATEFLGAWLRFWDQLPRSEREVRVRRGMVAGEGAVKEHLIAITETSNVPSQKVLLKSGFERFREFTEDGGETQLVAFHYPRQ
ncbi:hypothetical protein PHISP_08334 [Aspergillus sp. HF37]|nr:hypothetical protein PHISP_08334 [Aspergillus sp. HF37]